MINTTPYLNEKMKGFGLIPVAIAIAAFAILIGGGLYAWEKGLIFHNTSTDISNWKTYRNEKYGFEFKYPSIIQVYDYDGSTEYDHELEGLGDVTISTASRREVERSRRCDGLKGDTLPVDFSLPSICEMRETPRGLLIYGIGIDTGGEGHSSLNAVQILLGEKDFLVISLEEIVSPLPAITRQLKEEFLIVHPDAGIHYRGLEAHELFRMINQSLVDAINQNVEEVKIGMSLLRTIIKSIRFN